MHPGSYLKTPGIPRMPGECQVASGLRADVGVSSNRRGKVRDISRDGSSGGVYRVRASHRGSCQRRGRLVLLRP